MKEVEVDRANANIISYNLDWLQKGSSSFLDKFKIWTSELWIESMEQSDSTLEVEDSATETYWSVRLIPWTHSSETAPGARGVISSHFYRQKV